MVSDDELRVKPTVAELIEKLRQYPAAAQFDLRWASKIDDKKIIMVVEGHELDPVFQKIVPWRRRRR